MVLDVESASNSDFSQEFSLGQDLVWWEMDCGESNEEDIDWDAFQNNRNSVMCEK